MIVNAHQSEATIRVSVLTYLLHPVTKTQPGLVLGGKVHGLEGHNEWRLITPHGDRKPLRIALD